MFLKLVFIHGRFEDATVWEPLSALLVQRLVNFDIDVELVAIDVGKAASVSLEAQGKALVSLLENGPNESHVILVGHDTGAALAQVVAAGAFSVRIAGLVLLNPTFLQCPKQNAAILQKLPALLLWGARDGVRSLAHVKRAFALFQDSRFAACEGGHCPHREAVEWTAERMQEFIFYLRYDTTRADEKSAYL
jgi:pimeloyl-ACP methyl ester carboxylesterase